MHLGSWGKSSRSRGLYPILHSVFAKQLLLFHSITGFLKMPFNSVSETTKGVIKVKHPFSLKRKNAPYLGNEIHIVTHNGESKENAKPSNVLTGEYQEIKQQKRPLKSTYFNTLNASKRLKSITGAPLAISKFSQFMLLIDS